MKLAFSRSIPKAARQKMLETFHAVGTTTAEQLQWLWSFCHSDFGSSERERIGDEVQHFVSMQRMRHPGEPGRIRGGVAWSSPLTLPLLRQMQHEARIGLEQIRSGDPWIFKPGGVWVQWAKRCDIIVSPVGTPIDVFCGAVVELLDAIGPGLRHCEPPACGRLFAATHGRQEYCTEACASKVRSQRHYEKNREQILEDRHARYAKRYKDLPGAKPKRQARAKK